MDQRNTSQRCLRGLLPTLLLLVGGTRGLSADLDVSAVRASLRGAPADIASGIPAGLVVLPQGSDPALAIGLVRGGATVYCVDARADRVTALRQSAAAAGLLGRGLCVDQATGAAIPVADHYADLVLVADATEKTLPELSATEVARALSPRTGVALIGNGQNARRQLSRQALLDWARGAAFAKAEVVEQADSLWLVLRTARPPGYDDWAHWFHGPDQNPVSKDTVFDVPSRLGWLAKPLHTQRREGGRVISGGRIFVAMGAAEWDGGPGTPLAFELTARSAYNGLILWRRPLPAGTHVVRSLMVGQEDALLLLEGGAILRLDAATGNERARLSLPGQNVEGKWLAWAGGQLVVLVGPPDPPDRGTFGDHQVRREQFTAGRVGFGSLIAALDPASGAVRWRHESAAPVDGRSLAIAGGRLFYHAPGNCVACLDLASGAPQWLQRNPEVLAALRGDAKWLDITVGLEARPAVIATAEALYLFPPEGQTLLALSAQDGAVLWRAARQGGRAINALVAGNRLLADAVRLDGIVDALTGKPTGQRFSAGGCGVFCASPRVLCASAGATSFDMEQGQPLPHQPLKTQCHLGMMIAEGRMYSLPAGCGCPGVFGFACLIPRDDPAALPDARDPTRLERASHVGRDLRDRPVSGSPTDWPTHRGNERRSGVSPVKLADALALRWTAALPVPYARHARVPNADTVEHTPTAPVAAGDLVCVAGTDGAVRGLAASDGAPRWTFWCGGPVFSPPTIAAGCVYVGSADGYVYCLDAAAGQLLWRFRAAPAARRVLVYGHLQSPWPVNSGVLVHEGTAYAAAGMPLQGDTTVYALDAATGEVRWAYRPELGQPPLVANGLLALIDGRLWLRTLFDGSGGAAFDPASGTRSPPLRTGGLRGALIAQCGPRLIVYGGSDLVHWHRETARRETVALLARDPAGELRLPDFAIAESSLTAPAGDDHDLVVTAVGRPDRLECWDTARTAEYVLGKSAAVELARLPDWRLGQLPDTLPKSDLDQPPMRRWGPVPGTASAVALTSNAVVAVLAGTDKVPKLTLLDRTSGQVKWEHALPSDPVNDGLCVTRDGLVVVALRDGTLLAYGAK